MKYVTLFLTVFLFPHLISAQERSSNHDLRKKLEVFSIESIGSKKVPLLILQKDSAGQFSFSLKNGSENLQLWKVDSELAQKLDDSFVDKFINIKYMMSPSENKDKCSAKYLLKMRGEGFSVCGKDKKKVLVVDNFVSELKNKFKF